MKKLDAQIARDVVDGTHAAWSNGDIERLLSFYTDDLTYWCNAGSIEGTPYILHGKPAFRTFLHSIHAVAESGSVTEYFHFEDGVARTSVECYLLHRRTGLVLSGSFRTDAVRNAAGAPSRNFATVSATKRSRSGVTLRPYTQRRMAR